MNTKSIIGIVVVLIGILLAVIWKAILVNPIAVSFENLAGKTAIVTGGSAGIGLETVRKLVECGSYVLMPVRNRGKGVRVSEEIMQSLPPSKRRTAGSIEVMDLDLTSFASVKTFASDIINKNIHIDILILNAGIQSESGLVTTVDGVEVVYQVNHLSHFLLTRLLLPSLIKEPKPARIVHVSSSMHYMGNIDEDAYSPTALNTHASTSRLGLKSYCDSKLMNVAFSNGLERRLRADAVFANVTSVSIHPGWVISDIDRGLDKMQLVMKTIRDLTARSTAEGAVTQVAAAINPDIIAKGGGLYFEDHCIMNGCTSCLLCTLNKAGGVLPHSSALNETVQDWLWQTSSTIVGLNPDEVF